MSEISLTRSTVAGPPVRSFFGKQMKTWRSRNLPSPRLAVTAGSARLLLDGQQRLTSLSAVIRGEPVVTRGRKRPVELLFNLNHPDRKAATTEVEDDHETLEGEEDDHVDDDEDEDGVFGGVTDASDGEILKNLEEMTFVVKVNRIARLPNWISVSEVFANDDNVAFIRASGVASMDDPRFTLYNDRLNRLRGIRKYMYRVDTLERSLSYEEVTEIFVRVNSLGAKLRSSDLALAQITAAWRGSLEIFQQYQQECSRSGLDLDLGTHLRTLVALATHQSRFRTVTSISENELKDSWKSATKGTNFAVNFLRANCKISSIALLSSPSLVTALAYFGHDRRFEIPDGEARQLRRWALLANAKGRYSRGSSESLLDQDIATIRDGGGPAELLSRLENQMGRLEVLEADLAGKNQRSSLFKTLFIALEADGATDWKTGLKIALDHSGAQDRLQFHHIFPKDILKGRYSTQEVEDLSNLAFIGGKTNRQILNHLPVMYFPELVADFGEDRFRAHLVPLEPRFLTLDAYPEFLAERRRLLTARLNQLLNPTTGPPSNSL